MVTFKQVRLDALRRTVADIVCVQNLYNLANRAAEDVLAYCAGEGIAFIPWFPLATGELAGPGSPVARIAADEGVTPSQLALAWLLHRSPVILPIRSPVTAPMPPSLRCPNASCSPDRIISPPAMVAPSEIVTIA